MDIRGPPQQVGLQTKNRSHPYSSFFRQLADGNLSRRKYGERFLLFDKHGVSKAVKPVFFFNRLRVTIQHKFSVPHKSGHQYKQS